MSDQSEEFTGPRVRYAVVGAGHIAQAAVLPAFEHAQNAELVALFSSDETKRNELGKRYGIEHVLDYDDYDALLSKGEVDAVYISVPNHLHREYAVRAARQGVHVLCEKPMAVDEQECESMMREAEDNDVKLMIAYRLHFEPANMQAIGLVRDGAIGRPRMFESVFSQDVKKGDIRLMPIEKGGGPLYDMGTYCINAARYLFQEEPLEVIGMRASADDPRFSDSEETLAGILRFPEQKIASFVTNFSTPKVSRYSVIGDKGRLVMEPAYEYALPLRYTLEAEGEEPRVENFDEHDQFGPQLVYFADCILENRDPEPDGLTGLADVHIIRALHESAEKGQAIRVLPIRQTKRPGPEQIITRPGIEKPDEIHASSPSSD